MEEPNPNPKRKPKEEAQIVAGGATLIKHLAACNKSTRDKALKLLTTIWLPSQPSVSDDDMRKLWKGLFYSLWHADKAIPQAQLIDRLSGLLKALPLPLSLHYFSVFVLTLRREWSGIDRLRLDKFYLLIRRMVNSIFDLIRINSWDLDLLRACMRIFEEKGFFADDKYPGNGVNYHIVSVFLDELKGFLPVKIEALELLFKPFLTVMGLSQDKILVAKVKGDVFQVLLDMGKELLERKKAKMDDDSGDEVVLFGTIALTVGFSAKFYDVGSASECSQGNRKFLFGLHQEFLRLEKDLELSGIQVTIPEVKVDEDDDVPMLEPIVGSETESGSSQVTMEPIVSNETSAIEADEVAPENESLLADKPKKKKKKKKVKEDSVASTEKPKKKKKKNKDVGSGNGFAVEEKGNASISSTDTGSSNNSESCDGDMIKFDETVISNLQKQFEKVAAEVGMDIGSTSSFDLPNIATEGKVLKKRKRAKNVDGTESQKSAANGEGNDASKSGEKSAKKVRFVMKNNLVWKPHSPMPPESLRLPPSVTPRGSALKKGVPPGPVREMPTTTKRVKQKKKKARKGITFISPPLKRLQNFA